MLKNHCLLEIKTSKDSQETPETAVQLFSTLPTLYNQWWDTLLGRRESLSLEILVKEQSIHFYIQVPLRLLEYFKGAIHASYPEAVLVEQKSDPLDYFIIDTESNQTKPHLRLASFRLRHHSYLPLKTYADFKDIDPLATLLSTLSKNEGDDTILIQLTLDNNQGFWAKKTTISEEQLSTHPQKNLIEQKLSSRLINVTIKAAVKTNDRAKSKLLMENIAAAY